MRHKWHAFVLMSCTTLLALGLSVDATWAAAPGNDDITAATVISSLPYGDSVDIAEATTTPDEPTCRAPAATVWYTYTPATDTRLYANTLGSATTDTTLAVYSGSPANLQQIRCEEGSSMWYQARVLFDAQAGVTYYFQAGAQGSLYGDLQFNLTVAPPRPHVRLTIDRYGTVDQFGLAWVSGRIYCDRPLQREGSIYLTLVQRGRYSSHQAWNYYSCAPPYSLWSVLAVSDTGQFSPGKARARAQFGYCSAEGECGLEAHTRRVVVLRPE